MTRNEPRECAVFGIDIGKTLFHVVGLDETGAPVQKAEFRHATLLQFFERARPTVVAMEACLGSQWLARKRRGLGHDARILPAQFVKPYVKSNKNDIIDAEAIAEAATRPSMRFVGVKEAHQVDLQMLHRIRSRLVSNRTNLNCQMRSYCLEHGVALRTGADVFNLDIVRALDDAANDLTERAREVLRDLCNELQTLEERITWVSKEIKAIADADEVARRLMTLPSIGPLGATAILAAVGDPRRFRKARDIPAWLGLVPRQYSTGGKQTLLGIAKRGSSYLRTLLVHGARSVMMHLVRSKDRLGPARRGESEDGDPGDDRRGDPERAVARGLDQRAAEQGPIGRFLRRTTLRKNFQRTQSGSPVSGWPDVQWSRNFAVCGSRMPIEVAG